MDNCLIPHPEKPLTCQAKGLHAEHMASTGLGEDDWEFWPNEDFVNPLSRSVVTNQHETLLRMARNTRPAVRSKPRARSSDPQTSHAAAKQVEAVRQTQQEILDILRVYGPSSDEEIALYARARSTYQSPSGLRTRRAELVDQGRVLDSGSRKLTQSGRQTIVWARF